MPEIENEEVYINEIIEVVIDTPRQKRKYTKRAKMLLRSNNDYIDHTYWPRMYKKAKQLEAKARKEHPERFVKVIQPTVVTLGPVVTRYLTPEQLKQQDIDNCSVYGIKCSKHNMFHSPASVPHHKY